MSDPTPADVLAGALEAMTSPMRSMVGARGNVNTAWWEREATAILAALAERGYRLATANEVPTAPDLADGLTVAQYGGALGNQWFCDLDAAWAAAEAALPEGYDLMVGHTSECRFCTGWWATASARLEEPPYYPHIVSSETGRPRGEHHDLTPTAALNALAAQLQAGQKEPTE